VYWFQQLVILLLEVLLEQVEQKQAVVSLQIQVMVVTGIH
jgi:hypothetical protein